jgi:hypothetical protein
MHTDFVLDALEQALYARQPWRHGGLTHHSDRCERWSGSDTIRWRGGGFDLELIDR